MAVVLEVNEKSHVIFIVTTKTPDDVKVAPYTLSWTLHDSSGTIINNRTNVSISNPVAEQEIVVEGDDLQILAAERSRARVLRRLMVEGSVNTIWGYKPVKEVFVFYVKNLLKVT